VSAYRSVVPIAVRCALITIKQIAAVLPAVGLVLAGTVGLGIAEMRPTEDPSKPVGIVVAGQDSASATRVVVAAGGRLVAAGGWLDAVIAVSDDPEFVNKLYRAGASLVFRADNAVGCSGASPTLSQGTS
jgi:hypothetical protein